MRRPAGAPPPNLQLTAHQGDCGVEARRAHQHQAAQAVRLALHAAADGVDEKGGSPQGVPHSLQAVRQYIIRCAAGTASASASAAAASLTAAAAAAGGSSSGLIVTSLPIPGPHPDWHCYVRRLRLLPMLQRRRLRAAQHGSRPCRCHSKVALLHPAATASQRRQALPPRLLLLLAASGRRLCCCCRPRLWRALLQISPAAAAVHLYPAPCIQSRVSGGAPHLPLLRLLIRRPLLCCRCRVAPGCRQLSHLGDVDVVNLCSQTGKKERMGL